MAKSMAAMCAQLVAKHRHAGKPACGAAQPKQPATHLALVACGQDLQIQLQGACVDDLQTQRSANQSSISGGG